MRARDKTPTKQRTSREVYDRIRWDPRLDPRAYTIGYDAHAHGMKEVPLLSFVPGGDIPWHRVWYVRARGRIVWDRRTRYDEVFAHHDASGERVAPSVRWPTVEYFAPLQPHRFLNGAWTPRDPDARATARTDDPTPLRVLTWNVLDGSHEGEAARTPERIAAIPEALSRADVDVIALQEVTPALWHTLLATPWVREGWTVSDGLDTRMFVPHGVALLSRVPVAWAGEHRLRGVKRCLAFGLRSGAGEVVVVNLHLPSNHAAEAATLRSAWLAELLDAGLASTAALATVVLGDFNATERELAPHMTPAGFIDAWTAAGDGSAGVTYDPANNPLASMSSRSRQRQRLDRMYLRPGVNQVCATAASLAIAGPVATDGALLHLSDHHALRVVFEAEAAASARRTRAVTDAGGS